MIDVEREVFSPLAEAIRETYPGAFVTGEYTKTPARFPHISIVEMDNYMTRRRLDTAEAERYATLAYEVNVYSNKASGKKAECREIMDLIDQALYRRNFTRLSMTPVPNLEDATIYRINARYRVETDGENFYRVS